MRLRVAALLRRARERHADGRLRVGELAIDPVSREVRVRGTRVALSQKEFALLRKLAAEPTRVWTKVGAGFRADADGCCRRSPWRAGRCPASSAA